MAKLDLVNPWQRAECARMLRTARNVGFRGVHVYVQCARTAEWLARMGTADARPAYRFIRDQLTVVGRAKRDAHRARD
jgi:hypothetical protein